MKEKFNIKRIISSALAKGQRNYLDTQKKYEIIKLLVLFGLPLAIYLTGYISTGTNVNYLTIVAVVGFLPACKALVQTIMYLRYKSCPPSLADKIDETKGNLIDLYDCVFTAYQDTFVVDHLVVRGNTVCGITTQKGFKEKEFLKHMEDICKADGLKNVSIKVFTEEGKYLERLRQMQTLEEEEKQTKMVVSTFLSVCL